METLQRRASPRVIRVACVRLSLTVKQTEAIVWSVDGRDRRTAGEVFVYAGFVFSVKAKRHVRLTDSSSPLTSLTLPLPVENHWSRLHTWSFQ